MKPQTLVLIRHAHRDTADRSLDNGLSPKGEKQARRLLAFYRGEIGRSLTPRFVSSPSRRCVETMAPLARYAGGRVVKDPALLEQAEGESAEGFSARVGDFLERLGRGRARLTLVCSHGDWIPAAVRRLTGKKIELKKGGWAEVHVGEGRPRLVRVVQSPG